MSKMVTVNHEDPVVRTFILFMQMAQATYKYADSHFYHSNRLKATTYVALQVLVTHGGTMTHTEMATWTNTKRHNITTLVERMKENGLVMTERSTEDKRLIRITITDKGRETFKKASPTAHKIMEQLMLGICKVEALELERLLGIMKANIE